MPDPNFSMIDAVVAALLALLFLWGWSRGLLRIILGPLSLAIGWAGAYFYYHQTNNFKTSILIALLGPFAIQLSVSLILKFWHKTIDKEKSASIPSRFLGGLLSSLWTGGMVVLTLFLITLIPVQFAWLKNMQEKIMVSRTYSLISHWTINKVPLKEYNIANVTNVLQNPEESKKLQSYKEYKEVIDDKKIQALLADEEIAGYLKEKNMSKLLTNPKMRSILTDEKLLQKILTLNKKIIEQNAAEGKKESKGL